MFLRNKLAEFQVQEQLRLYFIIYFISFRVSSLNSSLSYQLPLQRWCFHSHLTFTFRSFVRCLSFYECLSYYHLKWINKKKRCLMVCKFFSFHFSGELNLAIQNFLMTGAKLKRNQNSKERKICVAFKFISHAKNTKTAITEREKDNQSPIGVTLTSLHVYAYVRNPKKKTLLFNIIVSRFFLSHPVRSFQISFYSAKCLRNSWEINDVPEKRRKL